MNKVPKPLQFTKIKKENHDLPPPAPIQLNYIKQDRMATPVRNYDVFPLTANIGAESTDLRRNGQKYLDDDHVHQITSESEPQDSDCSSQYSYIQSAPSRFCALCQKQLFSNDGGIETLACKHSVHLRCIQDYMITLMKANTHPRCPQCGEKYNPPRSHASKAFQQKRVHDEIESRQNSARSSTQQLFSESQKRECISGNLTNSFVFNDGNRPSFVAADAKQQQLNNPNQPPIVQFKIPSPEQIPENDQKIEETPQGPPPILQFNQPSFFPKQTENSNEMKKQSSIDEFVQLEKLVIQEQSKEEIFEIKKQKSEEEAGQAELKLTQSPSIHECAAAAKSPEINLDIQKQNTKSSEGILNPQSLVKQEQKFKKLKLEIKKIIPEDGQISQTEQNPQSCIDLKNESEEFKFSPESDCKNDEIDQFKNFGNRPCSVTSTVKNFKFAIKKSVIQCLNKATFKQNSKNSQTKQKSTKQNYNKKYWSSKPNTPIWSLDLEYLLFQQ